MLSFVLVALSVLISVAQANIPEDWTSQIDNENAFYAEDDTKPLGGNGYPIDMYL